MQAGRGTSAAQKKEKKQGRREEEEQSRIHVVFWDRRILGLGDMYLRLSFLVEVQRPAAFQSGQCSSHAAFLVGRAGQLPCCFSSGQCNFSCLFGATGRWRCQVGGRHLPIVSYGQSYTLLYSDTGFSAPTIFSLS